MKNLRRLSPGLLIAACLMISVLPVQADYASSERWFNSLSEEERGLLQSRLILVGHYSSITDATFGNYTYRAITAFQTQRGDAPTGVLTPRASQALLDAAAGIYQELGIDLVEDQRGQLALLMPEGILTAYEETRIGTAFFTPDDTLRLETIRKPFTEQPYEELYQSLTVGTSTRHVTYKHLSPETFVVSGTRGDRSFYVFINKTPNESVGFSLEWDASRSKLAGMLAVFVASHSYPLAFEASSKAPVAAANPPPESQPATSEGMIASGSGFFVAEKGVLVTNQHVIDGCSAIDVVGYGPARVVTSDETVDLAVLQLQNAKPHPIAEIRNSPVDLGEDVVMLGYPLADILGSSLNVGTGIVSAETGLGGERRWFTTNVGLQPGNSGGPILDAQGRVLGVAVAKIDDEKLLASTGNIAPNVGFAIKSDTVADYLSIFRLPEPITSGDTPKTVKELVEVGRKFTVQVVCTLS